MHRLTNDNGELKFGDLFAGGGGVTTGAIAVPGIKVVWALNHSKVAIEHHSKKHFTTNMADNQ